MQSVSCSERPAPVELVVQADFDNLNLLPDVLVEWRLWHQAGAGEENALGSKIQMIVFDLDGPILRRGVLDAGADHPAPARFVRRRECHSRNVSLHPRQPVVVVRTSGTTFGIKQHPIPSQSQAGCHSADEVRAAMKAFLGRERDIQIVSLDSCCAELSLDGDGQAA